jgi:hypothetical protein
MVPNNQVLVTHKNECTKFWLNNDQKLCTVCDLQYQAQMKLKDGFVHQW